jgi:hypothetical protein
MGDHAVDHVRDHVGCLQLIYAGAGLLWLAFPVYRVWRVIAQRLRPAHQIFSRQTVSEKIFPQQIFAQQIFLGQTAARQMRFCWVYARVGVAEMVQKPP